MKANGTLDLRIFDAAELELIEEIGRSLAYARSSIAAEVGLDVRIEIREIRKGSIEIFGIEVSAPKNGLASWLATALLVMECFKELPPTLDAIAELQKRVGHLVHEAVQRGVDDVYRRSKDRPAATHFWRAEYDQNNQPDPAQILYKASRLMITQQHDFEEDRAGQTNRIR